MPGYWYKIVVVWTRGVLLYPQQNSTARISNPKYDGSFIMVIHTKITHQVDLRNLDGLVSF